jgi:hypothetical protein
MGEMHDVLAESHKNTVMQDTWGHLYPEPGAKYYGELTIAVGCYGEQVIVDTDFPGLNSSPQRHAVEYSIFDRITLEIGIHRIKCGMWFFKTCHDAWLDKPVGRLINIQEII